MIIDSHCHLDNEKLQPRIKDIINSANKSNVKYILTICTDDLSFTKIINILNAHENVFGTYGIHPHETSKYKDLTIDQIQTLICFLPTKFKPQCEMDWYYGDNILQKKYKL